jgi:Ca2+-transporting ATPase
MTASRENLEERRRGEAYQGLSTNEARELLARFGPNALPESRPEALWRRLGRQLKSPLIYILLLALALDVAVWASRGAAGTPAEAIVIAAILVLNAALGVLQERRAERAMRHLRRLTTPQAWARRDGVLQRVSVEQLAPGDLVRIDAGERVPADAAVTSGAGVLVDESTLTGESLPVDKGSDDELYAGTLLVRGRAWAVVRRTGSHSALGRVAGLLAMLRPEPTPLERRLERFGRTVARYVVLLAVVLAVGGLLVEGWARVAEVLLFAVAVAVAAVPEGLPAILTVTLAVGVERMARRRAVVRRLAAVEALGSVTVIATDKTGTLTEHRLEVRRLDSPDTAHAVRAMVLASEVDAAGPGSDPLEQALVQYAAGHGVDPASLHGAMPRHSSRPFDSVTKFTRATVQEGGALASYLKGAPELLLARSRLSEAERASWMARVEDAAAGGFRTLGLAWADGEREDDLTWLGLAFLWDPPRPEVPDALRRARSAGIRVVMITGDHPATARTVARTLGIDADRVATGDEVARLDGDGMRRLAAVAGVFARVNPEHKVRIVEALQAEGEIVAMTGDGVNDAPALKRADVGIAMGLRGSDVAREVADLVLLDDNFATIVDAVEEGRGIYENIQKFVRFLFSTNLSEVLVVTVAAVAAFTLELRDGAGRLLLPLTAAQLLWINLLTDGAPALALGLDRNPGVMNRLPRNPAAPLLDRPSVVFITTSGALKAALALALLGALWIAGESVPMARSAVFAFLAVGQLFYTYPARRSELAPPPNPWVHWAVAVSLALQLLVLAVPPLQAAFDVVPMEVTAVLLVMGAAGLAWVGAEIVARYSWRTPAR